MSDLKATFDATVNYVQTAEGSFKPGNDVKLELYGLFKQATEGDANGKRPGITNPVGRLKFDAWSKVAGTSSEEAMQTYIDKVEALKSQHG